MDRAAASEKIKSHCAAIAQEMMHVNPAVNALDDEETERIWPSIRRRLRVSDPTEIRRILFGDNARVPQWAGYTLGYRMVMSYLERQPDSTLAQAGLLPGSAILAGSRYADS